LKATEKNTTDKAETFFPMSVHYAKQNSAWSYTWLWQTA